MIHIRLLSTCCMLIQSFFLLAQVSVSGHFERDTIEIGDEVNFTLSIRADNDLNITGVPSQFIDSIYSSYQTLRVAQIDTSSPLKPVRADYEILSLGKWEGAGDNRLFEQEELAWNRSDLGGEKLLENQFTLRFWDPGENVIFLPPVFYDANGGQEVFYDGGIVTLFVAAPQELQHVPEDSISLAPIKPILREPAKLEDYQVYFYGIGGLLLLLIMYVFVRRIRQSERKPEEVILQPEKPAHEQALQALRSLKAEKLWQKGLIVDYQSKLTFIIRQYLEKRYDINALEQTSDQILKKVGQESVSPDQLSLLHKILHVADLVKFAKATPEINIHEEFMDNAFQFVDETKLLTDENASE